MNNATTTTFAYTAPNIIISALLHGLNELKSLDIKKTKKRVEKLKVFKSLSK